MKRIFAFAAIFLIALILAGDVGLLVTYLVEPNTYALIESVSFLHYFLLHSNGMEFAALKAMFSLLLLVWWGWKFISPTEAGLLKHTTFAYACLWMLIGAIVLTGILGVLQGVAGMPADMLDFSALVAGLGQSTLTLLVVITFGMPLALIAILMLYNNCFEDAHADG